MRVMVAVALVMCASGAHAQSVTIFPFTGPQAGVSRAQVVDVVCGQASCVPASKVSTRGRPDWAKARRAEVSFMVTGLIRKNALELTVQSSPKRKSVKRLPIKRGGRLAARELEAAKGFLFESLGLTELASDPAPVAATPPPRPAPPPEPAPIAEIERPTPATRAAPVEPQVVSEPKAPARHSSVVKIDVGADLLTRRLEYLQLATANLRSYALPPVVAPALGVQFFPFALVRDDALAGLGLEVQAAFAPWIQSKTSSSSETFPTTSFRFDAAVRFDWAPISTYRLVIAPLVGVRHQSFTVGAAASGRTLDGLPNVAYLGVRAGLGLEVPIVPKFLALFGHGTVIPVLGSGQIVSAAYFPRGSTFGLEGGAGLSFDFTSFLQLRVSFEAQRYGLTFETQSTDPYVATGAVDTWLGGNASVRFSL